MRIALKKSEDIRFFFLDQINKIVQIDQINKIVQIDQMN